MSSAEAEQRRRDALLALRNKKAGIPASPLPFRSSVNSSPDAAVLVPASSSPAPAAPQSSKHFSNGFSRPANGLPSGVIPSSNLGRRPEAAASSSLGTPASMINAISRRTEQDDRPFTSSTRADLSPSSPAPLSRLKARYANDSPVKSLSSTSFTPPSTLKKTPSLIAAARAQHDSEDELLISRLANQFCRVSRLEITQAVRRHRGDPDRAVNEVKFMHEHKASVPSSTSPPQFKQPTPQFSSSYAAVSTSYDPLAPSPKVIKPRKNENSAIYKHQGKSKRRDPDESASAEEVSDRESEMSWSGDEGPRRKKKKGNEDEVDAEGEALRAFNEAEAEVLTGTIACSVEQAATIIRLRPYEDIDAARTKLTKARGVSFKLFEQYTEIMEGYVQIDACLNRCEAIAADVANTLSVWRGASCGQDTSVIGTPRSDGLNDVKVDVAKVSELLLQETDTRRKKILMSYVQSQPAGLREGTVLKDYQLLGVNWLNLLYSKTIGCILADEMGLGKTIQVIAFLTHLKDRGVKGPHMIFVPASTLENWIREFERFAPKVDVQVYYGTQPERAAIRDDLKRRFRSGKLGVVLASYTQVTSNDDLSFFRKKIQFETCIYDEGHKLKNCATKAYTDLVSIKPKWRLLLTGTPLQNNLQELVSLLMFIHKDVFNDAEPYLRAIFKSQGQANLLSQQRVSRARTMLTPFVLRRRKAHVLDLPPKIEVVEHCEMTQTQAKLYRETMQRGKKLLIEMSDDALEKEAGEDEGMETTGGSKQANGKGKKGEKKKAAIVSSGSHILMDLRKAASHPLLFRRRYTDAVVKKIAKECLNTPRWCDSNFDYVVEDLEIMSDAEIHHFCKESDYDELRKFALEDEAFLEGGKVATLRKHIERCEKEGKRMLLFSQFVMILDILEVALEHLGIRYTRLDGQTKTDERQGLVDEFNDDPDIKVFLLSTKAGGVGINLTAASVVVIYDQDFNPHNDRQAADRAYRIGQEREVEVIKLITKDSIDEDMLSIGMTKLQLDDAVGGEEVTLDGDGGKDDKAAKEVRKSLLTTLRRKFEEGGGDAKPVVEQVEEESVGPGRERTPVKKARGSIAVGKDEKARA